jgi:hypothetical protein
MSTDELVLDVTESAIKGNYGHTLFSSHTKQMTKFNRKIDFVKTVILTGRGSGDFWIKKLRRHGNVSCLIIEDEVIVEDQTCLILPQLEVLTAPHLVLGLHILTRMLGLVSLNIKQVFAYVPTVSTEASSSNSIDVLCEESMPGVKVLTLHEYKCFNCEIDQIFPNLECLYIRTHCPLSRKDPLDEDIEIGRLPKLCRFELKVKCAASKCHLASFNLEAPNLINLALSYKVRLDMGQLSKFPNLEGLSLRHTEWEHQSEEIRKTYINNLGLFHPGLRAFEFADVEVPSDIDFEQMHQQLEHLSDLYLGIQKEFDCQRLVSMRNVVQLILTADGATSFKNMNALSVLSSFNDSKMKAIYLKPYTDLEIETIQYIPDVRDLIIVFEYDVKVNINLYLETLIRRISSKFICCNLTIKTSQYTNEKKHGRPENLKYHSLISALRLLSKRENLKTFSEVTI